MNENLSLLIKVSSENESRMICDLLQNNNIDALSRGAKEYAGIVTGTDLGSYEILVPTEQLVEAKNILSTVQGSQITPQPHLNLVREGQSERSYRSELKRSIVFAVMGIIILPVVFNFASILAFKKFLEKAPPKTNKFLWLMLCTLLNLCSVLTLYLVFK